METPTLDKGHGVTEGTGSLKRTLAQFRSLWFYFGQLTKGSTLAGHVSCLALSGVRVSTHKVLGGFFLFFLDTSKDGQDRLSRLIKELRKQAIYRNIRKVR